MAINSDCPSEGKKEKLCVLRLRTKIPKTQEAMREFWNWKGQKAKPVAEQHVQVEKWL